MNNVITTTTTVTTTTTPVLTEDQKHANGLLASAKAAIGNRGFVLRNTPMDAEMLDIAEILEADAIKRFNDWTGNNWGAFQITTA